MMTLALYQPDIAPNLGAAMRLCACLGARLEVIEPCGFVWDDRRIRRTGLDYCDSMDIHRHSSWRHFLDTYGGQRRMILMTTRSARPYTDISFMDNDILIAGRESAGVPDDVHDAVNERVLIPMAAGKRSLNVVTAAAIVLGEAIRQTRIKTWPA